MSERVRIKICGLCSADDMRLAIDHGADFVGLIFADGPRRVDPDQLEHWLEGAREGAEVVGVFRNSSLREVLGLVERFDLDLVQLHGDESGDSWQRLPVRLIEARQVEAGVVAAPRFPGAAWAELLDPGAGSGQRFDWELAVGLARAHRIFLAGGLGADNVVGAIERVRPFAVDASSRLERRPGQKDPIAVAKFCAAVRAIEERGQ